MSFPFVQPYFGLGNSLQTAQGVAGGGVGGWVELARTTLGSANADIEVSSLPDKRYYMILANPTLSGSSGDFFVRLNGDTGSNYAWRKSQNGGAESAETSNSNGVSWGKSHITNGAFLVGYWANKSDEEKLLTGHSVQGSTAGAGTDPWKTEVTGKHAQTSDPINRFDIHTIDGTYASGSECVVLGWDPTDTHTTNFWEELASVTLGSDGDVLSSGTISAKKYLWVQAFIKNSGTSARFNTEMTFNGDTGSNYAERRSLDGAADATSTSQSKIMNSGVTGSNDDLWVLNMFVVNNSATEKLCIGHGFDTYAGSGAGTAPSQRFEKVAKWTNTSSQITNITITNSDTSNYDAISELRVWGSN